MPLPTQQPETPAALFARRGGAAMTAEWKDARTAPSGTRCIVGGHFLNPCIAIKDGDDHWFDTATGWEVSPQFWLAQIPPFPMDVPCRLAEGGSAVMAGSIATEPQTKQGEPKPKYRLQYLDHLPRAYGPSYADCWMWVMPDRAYTRIETAQRLLRQHVAWSTPPAFCRGVTRIVQVDDDRRIVRVVNSQRHYPEGGRP